MATESGSIQSSRAAPWFGPALVAATGAMMLYFSWGTWPDCTIDFGREIYTPWQLSEGKVLYRDIVSYFNGPFSPYLHALVFKIFGTSLRTLVVFNLCVTAMTTTLLYHLLHSAFGRTAATTGGVSFVILFAFAQLRTVGNYNFICPYSYELPHGIALSAGAIACLAAWHRRHEGDCRWASGWLALAAFLLGMVFLTKVEVFVAAALAVGTGLGASWWVRREKAIAVFIDAGIVVLAAVTPVLVALALLLTHLTFGQSLRALAGSWPWIANPRLLGMPYFKALAGTLDPIQSINIIFRQCFVYGLIFIPPAALGMVFVMRSPRLRHSLAAVAFVAVLIAGVLFASQWIHADFIRPAPLFLAAAALAYAVATYRRKTRRILELMLVVWALGLLAKIALNVHIAHYGFALAMPATLITLALLVDRIPQMIDRSGSDGGLLRATVLAAWLVVLYSNVASMRSFWSDKTTTVSGVNPADNFRSDCRGAVTNRIMRKLQQVADPDATLVVLPEGLIINYLTHHVNPTGQLNFTPPAVVMYGERQMLQAFRQSPPDFIIYIHLDSTEYGASFFGIHYAQQLAGWIRENYDVIASDEGMKLLRNKTLSESR